MIVEAGPVPDGVLAYFDQKKLRPEFSYLEVWREEHAYQFTVAKVTQADVLRDYHDSIKRASADGLDLRAWAKDLRARIEPKGWWGVREVIDKGTGEIADVDFSEPRRLRNVYETNMRTAHAAQQWQRIQRNKDSYPYLLRLLGPSFEHREQHVRWNGTLLPVGHPWWLTHPCPSGYGCKCHWRAVGEREYQQLLVDGVPAGNRQPELDPETGLPTGHLVDKRVPVQTQPIADELRTWRNRWTGETSQIPKGIDPGFDTNPGETYRLIQAFRLIEKKLPTYPEEIAQALIRSWMEGPAFRLWLQRPLESVPIALVPESLAPTIGAQNRIVRFSRETLEKQRREHPELTDEEYSRAARVIAEGHSIRDTDRSLVFILEEPDGYITVVKSTQSGDAIYLTSFRRLSSNAAKRDAELRRLLSRAK